MNVTELFRQLSYGELSNLSLGSEGSGEIPLDRQAKLIAYTNDGLLRLYSRFVLKESSLILELNEAITNYQFLSRYAFTNPAPILGDTLYIIDRVGDEFQQDLIKVLSTSTVLGTDLPLNDPDNPDSLFTPQPNILQIPNPIQGQIVSVVYQATHVPIPYDGMLTEIELPVVLESALKSYIAYKTFFHMNGQENQAQATAHLAIFETACAEIIERDLVNSSSSSTCTKFYDRGFI